MSSNQDEFVQKFNKRIAIELKRFKKGKDNGDLKYVSLKVPNPKNPRSLQLLIEGPPDTPFEGGVFDFRVLFGNQYPQKPPTIRCVTRIYHPNINGEGSICLSILKTSGNECWSPILTIDKVALSLLLLLQIPNYDDPLVASITQHFRDNPKGAKLEAIRWTKEHAMPKK